MAIIRVDAGQAEQAGPDQDQAGPDPDPAGPDQADHPVKLARHAFRSRFLLLEQLASDVPAVALGGDDLSVTVTGDFDTLRPLAYYHPAMDGQR